MENLQLKNFATLGKNSKYRSQKCEALTSNPSTAEKMGIIEQDR
jgi:hypothetical protein